MVSLFVAIYHFLASHRAAALSALTLAVVGAVGLAWQLGYEEDIGRFLPRNEQSARYAEVYQQLTGQQRIVVVCAGGSVDSIETALDVFEERVAALDSGHVVRNLQVRVDESRLLDLLTFVSHNAPYFMTDADWLRLDSLLGQPGYVARQLRVNKEMLMLPTASTAMETMRSDPLHLFAPMIKRLEGFKMSERFTTTDGYVFTADGGAALAFLESPYGISESLHNNELEQLLNQAMDETARSVGNVRLSAVGAPLVAVGNANQIKRDSVLAVSLAVSLILLVLILHYRKLSYLLWIGASLLFGWLFAIAGMGLVRPSVSVIVLGIGSVIIGIAVNYPLHFLDHYRQTGDGLQTLKDMVKPLLIGNITTVSAFLCLVWLDAAAMRDLGLFGSLMLVGTIVFVLVVLPQTCPSRLSPVTALSGGGAAPDSNEGHTPGQTAPAGGERAEKQGWQKAVRVVFFVLATLVLGYFSLKTSFDSDIRHINYMTAQQQEGMQLLSGLQQEGSVFVVAEGATLDEALEHHERVVQPVLQELAADSVVSRVSGVGHFLPSTDAQRRAVERWNAYWQAHRDDLLRQLGEASRAEGFAADAFQPFVDMVSEQATVKPASHFKVVSDYLAGAYVIDKGETVRVVSYVQTDDEPTVKQRLQGQAAAAGGGAFAFSSADVGSQLVEILSDSFNYIGFVCGFVVFAFLWLSFGSIEVALMSFLPLAVSWVWILGAMQLLGVQFNIVNIILATFIFGQGDDYTIFITEGLLYEYATSRRRLSSYRRSVALSAVLMFIGMGTLVIARHPALRSLGEVTIIGMGVVVVMAYYLPPLVFAWLVRGKEARATTVNAGNVGGKLPITLRRLAYSLYAMGFFLSAMYLFVLPYTWLFFHLGKATEERKLRYHAMLRRLSDFVIRRVPGVSFHLDNSVGETFERPAVLVSNHQSHLDLMCLMMLTPRIVFLTNDWVWRNPLYGMVIHRAEFYPVSDGIENHVDGLRRLYERGYSIAVFPEGTRSDDCSIRRFHKGAFFLAEQLRADVLPVCLHGVGHVLPKRDFMLRQGRIDVEVGKRISLDDSRFSSDLLERTRQMRQYYREKYGQMCRRIETADYWSSYQKYIDTYKHGYEA